MIIQPDKKTRNVNDLFYESEKKRIDMLNREFFHDIELTKKENDVLVWLCGWDIEVFFKVCKSYLNLSRECNCLSYDAITTHTAVVFTRYMMLSLESRESNDNRSLGELFYTFLTKCLTSHGYRHFKCCFKCSEPYLATTLNCPKKKSMIWLIHL